MGRYFLSAAATCPVAFFIMATINHEILFSYNKDNGYQYKAYLNVDGDICLVPVDDSDIYNFIFISKDDWEDFKNFIDLEMNKFNEND